MVGNMGRRGVAAQHARAAVRCRGDRCRPTGNVGAYAEGPSRMPARMAMQRFAANQQPEVLPMKELPERQDYERLAKRPVAWRVKDAADGWIVFQDEAAAHQQAEGTGALMQGLYVRDGT